MFDMHLIKSILSVILGSMQSRVKHMDRTIDKEDEDFTNEVWELCWLSWMLGLGDDALGVLQYDREVEFYILPALNPTPDLPETLLPILCIEWQVTTAYPHFMWIPVAYV